MSIKYYIGALFVGLFTYSDCYSQDLATIKHDAEYRNDSWSQNKLGLLYENGDGVEKNPKLAFSWFEKAANNGYMYAFYNLGRHYQHGLSVAVDKSKALYWYEKAAAAHHAHSCLLLGIWYLNGINVVKNEYKAAAYFKDAAFCGNAEGKYYLSSCYAHGYGVKQDSIRALLWIDRAIEDKYYRSYLLKGLMYQDGLSVNRNEKLAFSYYLTGDTYNDSSCQNSLAICYLQGKGVEPDTIKAIEYFEKSANNGDMYAQRNLAFQYLYGEGVEQDIHKAIHWFEKSAEQNDETSYRYLISAYSYLNDKQSMYDYAQKGYNLNYKDCMNALAYCYAKGDGCKKDYSKALSIIDKAISLYPDDPNLYDSKGEILWLKGSKKAAKEQWEKVNKVNPHFYEKNDSELNKLIKGIQ